MARRLRELALWAGAALGLIAIATGLAVTLFGFSFLVFRSGSMEPEIPTGGLAFSRTVDAADIEVGDVVSVIAGNGERITHRVVSTTLRGGEATLVLQGDANGAPDAEAYVVKSAEKVVASIPYGGYVVAHALTPPGLLAVACFSLMLLVVGFGRPDEDVDQDHDGDQGHDQRGEGGLDDHPQAELVPSADENHVPRAHRAAGSPWLRTMVVGAAVLAAVGAIAGGMSSSGTLARFTDQAGLETGTFSTRQPLPPPTGYFCDDRFGYTDRLAWGPAPGQTTNEYRVIFNVIGEAATRTDNITGTHWQPPGPTVFTAVEYEVRVAARYGSWNGQTTSTLKFRATRVLLGLYYECI